MAIGKYDVVSDIGPSYKTKRTEAAETLSFLIQTSPEITPFVLDLMASNMDLPFAPELTKRMRKHMLKQGMIDPNEEEQQQIEQQQQDPAFIQQQAMQQEMEMLQRKTIEAEARAKAAEAFLKELEVQKMTAMAQIDRDQAEADVEKTESETIKNEAQAELSLANADKADKEEFTR